MGCWGEKAGIREASVWDPAGELKHNVSRIEAVAVAELASLARDSDRSESADRNPELVFEVGEQRSTGETRRGAKPYPHGKVRVHVLSMDDGRTDIVVAARGFCRDVEAGSADPNGLTIKQFAGYMNGMVRSTPGVTHADVRWTAKGCTKRGLQKRYTTVNTHLIIEFYSCAEVHARVHRRFGA